MVFRPSTMKITLFWIHLTSTATFRFRLAEHTCLTMAWPVWWVWTALPLLTYGTDRRRNPVGLQWCLTQSVLSILFFFPPLSIDLFISSCFLLLSQFSLGPSLSVEGFFKNHGEVLQTLWNACLMTNTEFSDCHWNVSDIPHTYAASVNLRSLPSVFSHVTAKQRQRVIVQPTFWECHFPLFIYSLIHFFFHCIYSSWKPMCIGNYVMC